MDDRRGVIIVGAGIMQIPVIEAAKRMGLRTVVTDYNRNAPGFALADVGLEVSTRNIDFSVLSARRIAQHVPVDGVLTVGTDASRTVSAMAAALELPGIRYDAAERATNKVKMRQCFRDNGVPSPDFDYVWTRPEARDAVKRLGLPCVIKPADNMGARGVQLLTARAQVEDAFTEARRASVSGMIVVEEYMEGPELSIDALVWDGKIEIVGVGDRIISGAPYFIELGHTMPSAMDPEVVTRAVEVMKQGIRALGIDVGAAKGDIKLTPEGPKIGELAARLSGGYMSGFTYPLATGVDLMSAVLRISMGQDPGDLTPKWNRVAAERGIIPRPGVITDVQGLEEARSLPGVENVFTMYGVGDTFRKPTSNMGKFGNLIAVADDRGALEKLCARALSTIRIHTTQPDESQSEPALARAKSA